MVTIAVADVAPGTDRLDTTDTRGAIAALLGEELALEAVSPARLVVKPSGAWRWNPFVAAADCAWARHLPLTLTPDAVWLCIAQGVACALRTRPAPPSRTVLEVRRDTWMPGDPDLPWPEAFDEFAARITADHPQVGDLIAARFSTTGAAERAAFAVTLMDAMADYYAYVMTGLCGIPAITLTGTVDDWRALRARAARVADLDPALGLAAWAPALAHVCDRLVDAADGRADVDFFRCFYNLDHSSGGPYMTGWINTLFPFTWDYQAERFSQPNPHADRTDWTAEALESPFDGAKAKALPLGLSRVPMTWRLLVPPAEYRYQLLAGFVGVSQDPATLALRPEIGWAVRRMP